MPASVIGWRQSSIAMAPVGSRWSVPAMQPAEADVVGEHLAAVCALRCRSPRGRRPAAGT